MPADTNVGSGGTGASIRYDTLHEYATANRLDYNGLCRVVRAALAGKPAVAGEGADPALQHWIDRALDAEAHLYEANRQLAAKLDHSKRARSDE